MIEMIPEVIFPCRCFLFNNDLQATVYTEYSDTPGLVVLYHKKGHRFSKQMADTFKFTQREEAFKSVEDFISDAQHSPTSEFPRCSFNLEKEFLVCIVKYPNGTPMHVQVDVTQERSINIAVTYGKSILQNKDFDILNTAYDKMKKAIIEVCDTVIEERNK